MHFLIVSRDCIGAELARRLHEEGSEVKLHIIRKEARRNFRNIVPRTDDWEKELPWIRKNNGIIIFDDISYGKTQDSLRKRGYNVFGGSELGEKLEMNRHYAMEIFKDYGLPNIPTHDFEKKSEVMDFLKANKGPWALKMNRSSLKHMSFVSYDAKNRDMLALLETYRNIKLPKMTLQKTITGIEIAVSGIFNGTDWVGPLFYNVEHPYLFPGDVGPLTDEMGTLAWCGQGRSPLFTETLKKLAPYLRDVDYRGFIDINCIANAEGIYPIEVTARVGSPMVHLFTTLLNTSWSDIISATARGEYIEIDYKKNTYGVVVVCACPPFPYRTRDKKLYSLGNTIDLGKISESEKEMVHFEEVSKDKSGNYKVSDTRGYVLHVTGYGQTVKKAQKMAYEIAEKISFPKMFYRNDIGTKFDTKSKNLLKKWGYIDPKKHT
jgi:phosphoribosylamine--glycine ligase